MRIDRKINLHLIKQSIDASLSEKRAVLHAVIKADAQLLVDNNATDDEVGELFQQIQALENSKRIENLPS